MTEQEQIDKDLKSLIEKGFIREQDGGYVITEEGMQYFLLISNGENSTKH